MEIVGKKGEVYLLDEALRDKARALVEKYTEVVGHVDLQRVAFVRVVGVPPKKSGTDWLGKCINVRIPVTIIPRYVVYKLASFGLLDINQLSGVEDDIYNVDYIVELNDDAIESIDATEVDVEALVLLHELIHIPHDMEGIVQHDVQDFSYMICKFGPQYANGFVDEKEQVELSGIFKSFERKLQDQGFQFSKGLEQLESVES